jgi:hypothetical protein
LEVKRMDGTATTERPLGAGKLEDLVLSPEELAEEAAERERELGGAPEAVQAARERALSEAQSALDGKAEELREEAGEPVGEMPPGEPEDVMVPPDRLMVSGTAQGSKRKWNGKTPGQVLLKVGGMKIEVPEGDFKKGERIRFEGEAVIVSEGAEDKLDKDTKTPVEAVQTHKAVVLDFELRAE